MAVRRISDLPELYSNYADAELSNCLIEVSFNPRDQVYQSFYAHLDEIGSKVKLSTTNLSTDIAHRITTKIPTPMAVYDYIEAQGFIDGPTSQLSSDIASQSTIEIVSPKAIYDYIESIDFLTPADLADLGIDSLRDFINYLNSLLNTKNLFLFIAQWGVKYNDLFNSQKKILYDIVVTKAGYKTAIWQNSENTTARLSYIQSKYYNAHPYDIIFFQSINDAMKFAQRFKFLEGSVIRFCLCTDMIVPLNCTYKVVDDSVILQQVIPYSQELDHSDKCQIQIFGCKIDSVKITLGADQNITEYDIGLSYKLRRMFANYKSFLNSSYKSSIKVNAQPARLQYILFDYGCLSARDSLTFSNYVLNALNNNNQTAINTCAFTHVDYPIVGSNITLEKSSSFVHATTPIGIYGGSRSYVNGMFECISCNNGPVSHEGGTLTRDNIIQSFAYIETNDQPANRVQVTDGGIEVFHATLTSVANYPHVFARLSKSGSTYSLSGYVDYNTMSADYRDLSGTPAGRIALSTYVPSYYNIVVGASQTSGLISTEMDEDYSSFTRRFTGLPNPIIAKRDGDLSGYNTGTYSGSGFARFRYDNLMQSVVTRSKLFDNYKTDRLNANSRLRQWMDIFYSDANITMIYDDAGYQLACSDMDHGVSYQLANDDVGVEIVNPTASIVNHNVFNKSITVISSLASGTIVDDSHFVYSFEKAAGVGTNRTAPLNPITASTFAQLSAQMANHLGYTFTKQS